MTLLDFNDGLPVGSQVTVQFLDRGIVSGQAIATPGTASSSPLTAQPSTLQGSIIVDPQNATGVASAGGTASATVDGFTGRVFNSWANLVAAWGTISPFFSVSTTIVFASNSPASSDPIYFAPYASDFLNITIRAPLQPFGTPITLGSVVAKNRTAGANALLQADLGQSLPTTTTMLVNTTRGNSVAWVNALVAGTTYTISQPFAPAVVGGSAAPAQDNTWANGDAVNAFVLIQITPVYIVPVLTRQSSSTNQMNVNLYHVFAINNAANNPAMEVGAANFVEANTQGIVVVVPNNGSTTNFVNCSVKNGMTSHAKITANGGIWGPSGTSFIHSGAGSIILDGDLIMNGTLSSFSNAALGLVYLGTSGVCIQGSGGKITFQTIAYGAHVIYGAAGATMNFIGQCVAVNLTGTYAAAWTAPALVTPGAQLNGTSTGDSEVSGTPSVINGGIGTTVAALDAAAGAAGFGGIAFKLGGASIRNTA